MTASFWRDKRVLVTGHTGFKGAWLALWLAERGARVTGYALAPATTPSLYEQANVGARVDSVIADIRDRARVEQVVRDARPEIVFHLAAQAIVRESYAAPVETFEVNVLGTTYLLEALRLHAPSLRAALIVTTDKCYENREQLVGYREDDALGGHDPYSSSKACAELVTSAYRRSFFADRTVGIASGRAGNVIGGGDWAKDRVVPDLVRAFVQRESALIRNPRSVRPWQHVLDVVLGYALLAERAANEPVAYGAPWNFGPHGDPRSVEELANAVCARWGEPARWHYEQRDQPHEARALALDATKARTLLGWRPRLDHSLAIEWSVDWYKLHAAAGDVAALTIDQIRRHGELA